jgi:hydrogenase maturation protease
VTRVVVIGVGTGYRHDDAAGLEVARRVRAAAPVGVDVREHEGEPAGLIEAWEGASVAYVVDAVRGTGGAGTIHRLEAGDGIPDQPRRDSTHALALGEAVALARALDRLPARLVVIGIEGSDFSAGEGLSQPVTAAVTAVAGQLLDETRRRS